MRGGLSACLGVVAFAGMAGPGFAQTYSVYYPPPDLSWEINGSTGADTAGSFAAASRMGIRFFRNVNPPSESTIISQCQANTPAGSPWPSACNPTGMLAALAPYGNWVQISTTDQNVALSSMLTGLKIYRSPDLVPIYGQADHWVVVWKMVEQNGAVTGLHWLDGGSNNYTDSSGFNNYDDGWKATSIANWRNMFYLVVQSVPTSDPYYGKYLTLYDPPAGRAAAADGQLPIRAADPPSPLRAGERPTPALVQQRALEALRLGGLESSPEIWAPLQGARPLAPFAVEGVYPDGRPWNYHLVPFVDDRHRLIGSAILDSATATYQSVSVLSAPRPFRSIAPERARQLAQSNLRPGEQLGDGRLTWDPAISEPFARTPFLPYFEFDVKGPGGEDRGAVIVRAHDGTLYSVEPCRASRRFRAPTCPIPPR